MSIDATTASTASVNSLLSGQASYTEKTEDPLGRDAFLTMLVAQLKHQDPLNPMEGADFSAQLAQFSTLEQMFKVNDNLEAIHTDLGPTTDENLIDYIGKEIISQNDSISLSGGDAAGGFYTIGSTANILVNIYDSVGTQVAQVIGGQKEAGTHAVEWNGTDGFGDMLPDGSYTFEVIAVDENYNQLQVETTMQGIVSGVTYEYGTPYLLMADNKLVAPESVIKILSSDNDNDNDNS